VSWGICKGISSRKNQEKSQEEGAAQFGVHEAAPENAPEGMAHESILSPGFQGRQLNPPLGPNRNIEGSATTIGSCGQF
jgi:hypothetical protein